VSATRQYQSMDSRRIAALRAFFVVFENVVNDDQIGRAPGECAIARDCEETAAATRSTRLLLAALSSTSHSGRFRGDVHLAASAAQRGQGPLLDRRHRSRRPRGAANCDRDTSKRTGCLPLVTAVLWRKADHRPRLLTAFDAL